MRTFLAVGIVFLSIYPCIKADISTNRARAADFGADFALVQPLSEHGVVQHLQPLSRELRAADDVRGVDAVVFQQFSMLECSSGEFSDSSSVQALGNLRFLPQLGECPPSTGLRVPQLKTTMKWPLQWQSNNGALANRVAATQQYSVALWLRLDPSMPVTASTVEFYSLSRGFDWEDQIRGAIAKNSVSSASLLISAGLCHFESCPTLTHTFPLDSKLFHVAVVVDGISHRIALYLNGVQAAQRTLSTDYKLIFPADSAGLMGIPSSLPGTMYSFAVYDKALNAEDIAANFASGITDSLALAMNVTLPYPEDGCSECHDLAPELFQQSFPPHLLKPVQCPYYDFDEAELQLPPSGICVLTRLPNAAEAEVYDLDGRLIENVPHTLNETHNGTFVVRPALNTFGNTISIQFQMHDVVANTDSEEAVILLEIFPVNDPPVASYQALTAFLGSELPISFTATDVDGDAVVAAVIESLPDKGELYTVEHGQATRLQVGDSVPMNMSVVYRYTQSPPPGWTAVTVAEEHFSFYVLDEHGARSPSQTIDVEVQTALRIVDPRAKYSIEGLQAAKLATDIEVTERNDKGDQLDVAVTLYGADLRSGESCIKSPELIVQSIPSEGELWALDAQGQQHKILMNGVSVPMATNSSSVGADLCLFAVTLHYVPPAFYFNTPSETWDGHAITPPFTPAISVAIRDAAQPASISAFVTMALTVRNVVSPVTIVPPNSTFKVAPFGDPTFADRVEIKGFTLADPDLGVSPIVVEVLTSRQGKLSLNPSHVAAVQFNSQSLCRINARDSRWKCHGSGNSDTSMRFVGSVAAVVLAVNGMIYRSTAALTTDSIHVKVYRGAYSPGDPAASAACLDSIALTNVDDISVYNACYESAATTEVEVNDYSWTTSEEERELLVSKLSYGVLIGLAVLVLSQVHRCCLSAVRCIRSNRKTRGKSASGTSDDSTTKRDSGEVEMSSMDDWGSQTSRDDFDALALVGVGIGSDASGKSAATAWRIYRAQDGGVYFVNSRTGERTDRVYPIMETVTEAAEDLASCAV